MVEHDHEMPRQCAVVRDEFSALLDDELAPGARAEVEAHLGECSACLRALDGMKKVTDLYAALPRIGAPEDFEARVRRAVRPGLLRFPMPRTAAWASLAAAAGLAAIVVPRMLREEAPRDAYPMLAQQAEMRSVPPAGAGPSTDAGDLAAEASPVAEAKPEPVPSPEVAEEEAMSMMAAAPVNAEAAAPEAASRAMAKAAPAPPVADKAADADLQTTVTWHAAGRAFTLLDNAWVEAGGVETNTTELHANSREFQDLATKFPELLELTAAEIPVVFHAGDDTWYRLQPKKN